MAAPPTYEDRIVAFVDILGWSDLLRAAKDPNKVQQVAQVVERLEILSEKSEERRAEFSERGFPEAANTRFSCFSDTVVLSCPASVNESSWMIWEVQLLCSVLLRSRQYARGAVVRGELVHTKTLLFGPALVQAHEIERDVAKYPRLVVTTEAAPFVLRTRYPRDGAEAPSQWNTDADGLRFLEVFPVRSDGKRLQQYQDEARIVRASVESDLRLVSGEEPNLARRAKYGWMLRYLDSVLAAESAPSEGT